MSMGSRTYVFDQFISREIREGADLVVNPALARATANRAVGNQRVVVAIRTVGFTVL
jgi:phosphatidylserine decarboxylase